MHTQGSQRTPAYCSLPLTHCLIPSRPGLTLKSKLSWQPGRPSDITEAGHLSQYWVNANTTTSSSLYAFWGFDLRSSNLCGKCSYLLRHFPVCSFITSCRLWLINTSFRNKSNFNENGFSDLGGRYVHKNIFDIKSIKPNMKLQFPYGIPILTIQS